MASSSLKNASPDEAQSQVSALPVDTFTEQLTHEPQRKAKLYSLPLIRTAVALVTSLWVVGVYAGNPDGFWQAQINTFMVAIAGLAVAWTVGGWMTCLIRRGVGVAIPKRGGDVCVNSFPVGTFRSDLSENGKKVMHRYGDAPRRYLAHELKSGKYNGLKTEATFISDNIAVITTLAGETPKDILTCLTITTPPAFTLTGNTFTIETIEAVEGGDDPHAATITFQAN